MPELPEVESVRVALAGELAGRRVEDVRPGEATVHLLRVSDGEQPGEGNLLFSCAAPAEADEACPVVFFFCVVFLFLSAFGAPQAGHSSAQSGI